MIRKYTNLTVETFSHLREVRTEFYVRTELQLSAKDLFGYPH